jgi:UDP:flavonoid glycosyltransferase YjiC (YdhE family)
MHITILALGSHGDVLPFAVLGKGLREIGHQVRVATFESFRSMVETRGLELFHISGDAQALMGGRGGLALAESGVNVIKGLKGMLASFGALTGEYLCAFSDRTLWETDLVINQLPVFGDDLCEKLGVSTLNASVIPLARTREFPIPLLPQWSLGSAYNALSYRLAEQLAWQPFRVMINRWRRDVLGLGPKSFWGNFGQRDAQTPVLAGFSEWVVPKPADWGEHIHVTGYWFPEADPAWQPSDALLHFLDAGSPPIFIGFGSMPIRDPERLTRLILAALHKTGQRGILSSGWGNFGDQDLPCTVFQVGYTPYSWLFPRTVGTVIHGGSGSTGAALRAGIPTLVVPFVMDQFFWGKRVAELGVGPEPIPFKQLNEEQLATAFDTMISNGEMQRRAAEVGEKIRAEDGVARAVELIEQVRTKSV